MRFGYTILYVRDVDAAIAFYERAFGFSRTFVTDDNRYGELDTGSTTLSFSSYEMARSIVGEVVEHDASGPPLAAEIAFVTDDVATAYERALAEGARAVSPPADKPWGQTVSYVRDPEGILVEICSEVSG